MSISSSMNAGVAGLKANATRLATISDNIANSATYGYRRAQTSFHSMITGSGMAGQGGYSAGGVRSTTVRMIDQAGSLISTDNPTDIAISGRGFLPVTTELGAQLTDGTAPLLLSTTGSFRQDSNGFLKNEFGHTLMGWPANPDGTIPSFPRDSTNGLQPVQIDVNQQAFSATSKITFGVNLPASGTLPGASTDPVQMSVEVYNDLGLPETIDVVITPEGSPNTWTMNLVHSETGDDLGEFTLEFDDEPGTGGTLKDVTGPGYDLDTGEISLSIGNQSISMFIGKYGEPGGMSQKGSSFSPAGISQNGSGTGGLVGLMVDANGNLDAIYDQGFRQTLFQIPVVDVPNPNGLNSVSGQAYQVSRDSGAFFLWDAGDGPVGEMEGFSLEESATDIAAELTGLIQTQRAYSSNAKVIQTVDEMLQETTNIKR